MPNHWHFVLWPERDGDLSAFLQQLTNTHVKRWKQHHGETGYGQPQSEAELRAVRRCVNRGCPFGRPDWVVATARQLGLESTLRQRGRPRGHK